MSDYWKHFKKNHAKITFFTSKMIKMISTYFSEDLKCSVKLHLDEALQPKTPAEYIFHFLLRHAFRTENSL